MSTAISSAREQFRKTYAEYRAWLERSRRLQAERDRLHAEAPHLESETEKSGSRYS